MTGGNDPRPWSARLRQGLAALCIGGGVALMFLDAMPFLDYRVDPVALGLAFGTGMALLTVEAGRKLLDRLP